MDCLRGIPQGVLMAYLNNDTPKHYLWIPLESIFRDYLEHTYAIPIDCRL